MKALTFVPLILPCLVAGAPAFAAEPVPPDSPKVEAKSAATPDDAHFRFGLGIDGDGLFAPGLSGAGIGLTLRLGVQINQWTAIYYQAHGIVGGVLGDSSGGVLGESLNSAMAELTLPFVQIGAGPSVDYLGVAGCDASGACGTDSGAHFGIDGRVALVLGGHGPGSHGGFALNFNAHPTFVDGGVLTTLSFGLGGELY